MLCCGHCGSAAGIRYKIGDDLHIYLFQQYRDMKDFVLSMPDTKQVASVTDVLGEVSFLEFDDAIREIRECEQRMTRSDPAPETEDAEDDYGFDYYASYVDVVDATHT